MIESNLLKNINKNALIFRDRKNTNSLKYDGMEPLFGRGDLEPFWVADMDFEAPHCVVEAIAKRAKHNVYGYPMVDGGFYDAVSLWFAKRFDVDVKNEWIVPLTGVAASMFTAILAFSAEGDGVVVQPPVYGPFFGVARGANRKLIENPLLRSANGYEIDFDGLERIFQKEKPKILLFCSPHNPVGRVWSIDELSRLAKLCIKHGVLVVSDEIHFDLVFKTHTPLLAFEELSDRLVLLSAPTKTFNIPGLNVSYAVIPSKNNKKIFEHYARSLHQSLPNVFGIEALKAAYNKGDEWLDSLKDILAQNKALLDEFVLQNSFVSGFSPEGTYLYWLDFSATGLSQQELRDKFSDAGIALSGGDFFFGGRESVYFRFNFATQKERVEWALGQIKKEFTD
ncbi:MAG: PatB family C-S lyase [Campylobacterales bacterium]|nr:PatB family C-S lyase [Campylobacterales bacterium]